MLIKVLPFNSHSITHLEEILIKSPEGPEGGDELGADLMLFRFLIWKLKKLDCKNIVVERNYLDRDFSEDYSSYYSGTFIDTGKYCVRLHFFKAHDFSGPLPFGDDKDREKIRTYRKFIQEAYCGFIVVLPTLRGVIGRTVITPSFGLKYENYCTTKASTKVNLEGVPLIICGAPFIQKDAPVGVCASTAIWITSRILHLLYQFPRYSLSRITEAANKYIRINRTFPATRGLTVEQIISGLIELGYTPLVYRKHTFHERHSWNPKEIIYKYVESGLPAIVVVGGMHACVVIGHNFDPNMKFKTGKTETVISNSAFIDSFIVHDDALGPYLVMPEQSKVSPGGHKYTIERKLNPFEDNPEIYTPYSINDMNGTKLSPSGTSAIR